jgi:hypothetical protein
MQGTHERTHERTDERTHERAWESCGIRSRGIRELRSARSDDPATRITASPMKFVSRTQLRCTICGFTEIRTDEVFDRGLVFLAECRRCDHRWTSTEPIAAVRPSAEPLATVHYQRAPARVDREVLPAA